MRHCDRARGRVGEGGPSVVAGRHWRLSVNDACLSEIRPGMKIITAERKLQAHKTQPVTRRTEQMQSRSATDSPQPVPTRIAPSLDLSCNPV